ncbi:hypothetical protein J3E06_000698 [Methanococcus voltae]|nr:hypothetical protein [Methanococcus voltae]
MVSLVVMCSGCVSSSSSDSADDVVVEKTSTNDNTEPKENEETKDDEKPKTEEPVEEGLPDEYVAVFYEAYSTKSFDGSYGKEEAADGKKYLIVDITVYNNGYDEISVNPLYFDAIVDGVEYDYSIDSYSLENDLDSVNLRNGGKTSGSLAFEIPEDSSSTYSIEYNPITWDKLNIIYNPEDVDIEEAQKAAASSSNTGAEKSTPTTSNDDTDSDSVNIITAATVTESFNYNIGSYEYTREAPSGKTYLITYISIENNGYDEISTSPLYFDAIVDGVGYSYASDTYSLENHLESVDLRNGGKTSGLLIYEIPKGSDSYELEYDPISWDKLNIKYEYISWDEIE